MIASGLNYAGKNPKTGEHDFDKFRNAYVFEVEKGLNASVMIQVSLIALILTVLEQIDSYLA